MASGKTTAGNYLRKILDGSLLLDVDSIAREIYFIDDSALKDVISCFGQRVCLPDGTIDYSILGNMVFSSKKELDRLNNIMFPRIKKRVSGLLEQNKEKKYIIIDAAILFGAKLDRFCDFTLLVRAPEHLRLRLLKSKCSLNDGEIKSRLEGQHLNIDENLPDFIIDNSGTKKMFFVKIKQVAEILRQTAGA